MSTDCCYAVGGTEASWCAPGASRNGDFCSGIDARALKYAERSNLANIRYLTLARALPKIRDINYRVHGAMPANKVRERGSKMR